MNKRIKAALGMLLLVLSLAVVTSCGNEISPYDTNNAEGYTVSVKYDANGGTFTTNTSVIVDSYSLAELPKDGSGKAKVALLAPDNALRGNDAFSAVKKGYFLAGWYSRGEDGAYSNKWDFSKDTLALDASAQYSADEPVLTLYAVWIPLFKVDFHSLKTGELISSYEFDPTADGAMQLKLPKWSTESGRLELYKFPDVKGSTFTAAYFDAEGKNAAEGESLSHTGVINYDNGTAEGGNMKLYLDYADGEWFHIYTAEQFCDNASVAGNYVIHADLDFANEIWPTSFMYGNFVGTIEGNGHKFSNIKITQTDNSRLNAGLFGNLTEKASVTDVSFENVSFTIKAGARNAGASFGLLAGSVSSQSKISGVKVTSGELLISSGAYFATSDYSIGLVCGMGNVEGIDLSAINCSATGDAPEKVVITVDGNTVNVVINN